MKHGSGYVIWVALLVAGSAIALLSCSTPTGKAESNDEKLVTRTVNDMEMTESENGRNSMIMRSPLVEEHALADPAYTEHPRGIELVGYDSLGLNPATRIIADNALNWTQRNLWQLSGNVFAQGEDRRRLYTQQLFYDAKTGKIWSNVDCKFEMGEEVFVGVGFDATSNMDYAAIREITGYFNVDMEGEGASDDASADSLKVDSAGEDTPGVGTPAGTAVGTPVGTVAAPVAAGDIPTPPSASAAHTESATPSVPSTPSASAAANRPAASGMRSRVVRPPRREAAPPRSVELSTDGVRLSTDEVKQAELPAVETGKIEGAALEAVSKTVPDTTQNR